MLHHSACWMGSKSTGFEVVICQSLRRSHTTCWIRSTNSSLEVAICERPAGCSQTICWTLQKLTFRHRDTPEVATKLHYLLEMAQRLISRSHGMPELGSKLNHLLIELHELIHRSRNMREACWSDSHQLLDALQKLTSNSRYATRLPVLSSVEWWVGSHLLLTYPSLLRSAWPLRQLLMLNTPLESIQHPSIQPSPIHSEHSPDPLSAATRKSSSLSSAESPGDGRTFRAAASDESRDNCMRSGWLGFG